MRKKLFVFAAICAAFCATLTTSSTRCVAASTSTKTATFSATATDKKTSRRVVFLVEGMRCVNCSKGLTKALQGLKGVRSAQVDLVTKRATIVFDSQLQNTQKLRSFIAQTGFKATPVAEINPGKKS